MCVESQIDLMPDFFGLLQEARKTWNYFLTDRLVYSSEMLDGDHDVAFTKKDVEFRHWIELHIRLVGHCKKDLCMILEFIDPERIGSFCCEAKFGDGLAKRDVTMLVDIPQHVQDPEEVQMISLPLVVWLQTPNDRNRIFGNPESSLSDRNLGINGVLTIDGKTDFFGGSLASTGGQLPSQVVKGRSQTADEIASDQCPGGDVEMWWAHLNDVLSTFKIVIGRGAIGFRFSRRFYEFTQGIKVHLRPNGLMEYAANW
jgi:hypothetical protein